MKVVQYSLLRLGIFVLLFVVLLNLGLGILFSGICGLLISWAVGYLFFNNLRIAAGEQMAARFGPRRTRSRAEESDNAAEDEQAEKFHEEQERLESEDPTA